MPTRDLISVSGVGFDIACGNLAGRTDATLADVRAQIARIMDDVVRDISFGMGQHAKQWIDHELFDDPAWDAVKPMKGWKSLAEAQPGTVGSGNHYVDVFADGSDHVWVGVHFGSRGLGHKTATYFLHAAGGKDGMDVPPAVVNADSTLGQDYLAGMALAGRYAYAGGEAVARHVVENILGANAEEEVHNHHNFAWAEAHDGETYWVVRKGATPGVSGSARVHRRAAWATTPWSSKAWTARSRAPRCIRRSTGPVGSCRAQRRRENSSPEWATAGCVRCAGRNGLTLPVRPGDRALGTVRGPIRAPTVIRSRLPAGESLAAGYRRARLSVAPVPATLRSPGSVWRSGGRSGPIKANTGRVFERPRISLQNASNLLL